MSQFPRRESFTGKRKKRLLKKLGVSGRSSYKKQTVIGRSVMGENIKKMDEDELECVNGGIIVQNPLSLSASATARLY
jgi:hypothetical protein